MPLARGRSVRLGGYLHRDSIGAAPSGAAPNFSPRSRRRLPWLCSGPWPRPHRSSRASGLWRRWLPIQYRIIRLVDPLARAWWTAFGLGNVVELRVAGRRTGTQRRILLGLLRSGEHWFLGHPNGDVAWTRNLEAAEHAELVFRPPTGIPVRATRLPAGELRDAAIASTGQHVFPGNLVYRLARRHIRAVGTYFLVEPIRD